MGERVEFTKDMREDYTILAPNMLTLHFNFIEKAFRDSGYKVKVLKNAGRAVVDTGLKYVHNDTCYPALLVIGQFIDALLSGDYDVNKVALMITQTGGGCRASNYIHLLRKALKKAGLEQVPIISLNFAGMEKNSGFKLTLPLIKKMIAGIAYADFFMLLKNQIIPYEKNIGETEKLINSWTDKMLAEFRKGKGVSLADIRKNINIMVKDFADIQMQKKDLVKVGVVGEIYIKYSSLGNNNLEEFLHSQNCEYMVPGLMGFLLYNVENQLENINLYGGSKVKYIIVKKARDYFIKIEKAINDAIKSCNKFTVPGDFFHLKSLVKDVVSFGNKMGEGWLLTAEMLELCEQGFDNIVCAQPFGCLPNHIVGKGMIRKIKEKFPQSNIVAIDYDPGATKVNQENRIKLMLAVGKDKKEGSL